MEHEIEPLKTPKLKKKTLKEKYQYLRKNYTVEPVLACYVIPVVLSRLATQNLNLDKACRLNLKYGDEVCDALIAKKGDMYLKEETAVQELIAGLEAWKTLILAAVPSFLILFLGAWSDRTRRRKICILLPIVGDLLACLSDIISTYFFYELPLEVCMFLEAFFPAITGGWITMFMGAFCHISDISTEENRTFRVGVVNLCLTAGGPIGMALSGILLEQIGYYGVFSISSFLILLSLIYGVYYIKDTELPTPEKAVEVCIMNEIVIFLRLKNIALKNNIRDL